MSRNIKSLKKLHSLIGQVVHVVDSEGHTFDAVVEKCSIPRNPNKYAVDLVTAYDIAGKDPYWWPNSVSEKTWGHHVVRPHQLTEELRSVTTIKEKAETKTVEVAKKSCVSFMDLLANEGHYCEMADGTTGYIAGSKYPDHVCVIHNSEGPSEGWIISRYSREEEILGVSKSFIKKFSKAWHVGSEDEAEQVKVAKILDKVRKSKKAKQEKVTLKALKKSIGHCCTFDSGDKGYICETAKGSVIICFNTKQHGCGWEVDEDVPEYLHKHFKYAWFIGSDALIKELGIVSIDSEPCELQKDDDDKCAESSKTILDMTIREVLEKLDEIIKR